MSFYQDRVLPHMINLACASKPTRRQREKIVPRAYGDVLKPHGHLFFCEHGKAPDDDVSRWQQRLNAGWRLVAGGCNMNRDIPGLLRMGGFRIEDDQRMYLPGIRALSYNYWGAAR